MKKFVQFQRPPVIEVVSGITFEPIRNLRAPHFGLFWSTILGDYPECQHAAPLGLDADLPDIDGWGLPLPRVWLIHRSKAQLIQLQRDRFYYNWREGPERAEYTGYSEIYKQFWLAWMEYVKFLNKHGFPHPAIQGCELTYVNHLPKGEGWESVSEIGRVLATTSWTQGTERFLPEPKGFVWSANFELPDKLGRLNVKLSQGVRRKDGRDVLVLELSASGLGEDKSDNGINRWFSVAHEWIVRGFADLTTKDAHSMWGREPIYE